MYKSVEEINQAYDEHIESLQMSGIDFDIVGLEEARQSEIEAFLNPSE